MHRALIRFTLAIALAAAAIPSSASDEAQTIPATASALRMLAPYRTLVETKGQVAIVASPVGTGRIVLDVLDGKAAAAVVAMPLSQAVDAARLVAWEEGRLLLVPETIEFHPIASLSLPDVPLGFVTIGKAPAALNSVLSELR